MTDRAGPLIVPLDGSDASRVGLQVAIPFAQAVGAGVVLVWVYEGLQGLDRGLPQDEAEAADRAEIARRRGILEGLREEQLEPAGIDAEVLVPMGAASRVVRDVAADHQARAIVMATHSRGALPRWYIGSVAMEVAHTAAIPTILFHADADHAPPADYRRVATPVEMIAESQEAVDAAAITANDLGAELILVSLSSSDADVAAAHGWHTALEARYPDLQIRHETRSGRLVDALRQAAAEVDLVVMPMLQQEGWRRFFSGEDWDEVVREAGVPVMLVHGPDAKPETS